jgi:hypothetical protein
MPEAAGAAAAAPDPVVEELVELVHRADQEGDAVLPDIRVFFDAHPDLARRVGDLAQAAQLALIELGAGTNAVVKEATLRRAAELGADLAGADPSPLEKVLAANVAVAWLAVAEAETTAARARSAPTRHADYLDRRRDRAHKRLESAARTLASVRKLLRPAPSPVEVATRMTGTAGRMAGRQTTPAREAAGAAN